MPHDLRTQKDRIYFEIFRKHGELTNTELRRFASESSIFREMSSGAIEKDVDRFVSRSEYMGLLTRSNGKLQLATNSKNQIRGNSYPSSGFLTSRNGVICHYCAHTIDLAKVTMTRRIKSEYLRRLIVPRNEDPFRVLCPYCKKKSTYDMKDIKPILPETPE